ncbi:DUF2793 domain-containing protein [Sphingomonas sp. SFZ2018-12]|uniref:DUF2793 domain-containing protein n=2 Tax=unclassified Sphingomonas TaxID=196159 RepID=UPI001F0D80EF|nr:DUF2793 domain-containing protein [Sphingomonas sp. SFZ2018-12]
MKGEPMDDDKTPRFSLPMLYAGQAQKELTHNEALVAIDTLLHLVVRGTTGLPPEDPTPGDCWIVGAPATDVWTGREGQIATWTTGGWRHHVPTVGMSAWSIVDGVMLTWLGAEWSQGELRGTRFQVAGMQVVGARQPAIADPSGGAVVDQQARATIAALLSALRAHGLIAAA